MAFTLALPKINISGENALTELVERIANEQQGFGLIIADPAMQQLGHLDTLCSLLDEKNLAYSCFTKVIPNPTESLVNTVYDKFLETKASYVIGFGGGSAIDTAKAIRILSNNPKPITTYNGIGLVRNIGCPLYAINTTAGTAAEVTSNTVIIDETAKIKCVIIDPNIIPDVSVNDPSLMLGIPADITAATGMDALTHAIEAYVSIGAHTLTNHSALESIKVISEYLPLAVENGKDFKAREMMAYGQFLAGMAFNSAGLGMVHAMAHPAGAHCDLPHGVCNAILLPIVSNFNRPARIHQFANIAKAMGVDTRGMSEEKASIAAIQAIQDLSMKVGIPTGFAKLGITEEMMALWVPDALADPCAGANPTSITAEQVIALYRLAL